jgi:hypothetical protein
MFRERETGVGVERGAGVPVATAGTVGTPVSCGAQAGSINEMATRNVKKVKRVRAMETLS